MSTSEYLRDYLKDFDEQFEKEERETPEEKSWRHQFEKLQVDSVEGILPHELKAFVSFIRSHKESLQWTLDDHYTRLFINEIPSIVNRALKLEPLLLSRPAKGRVEVYLRESTRAYILGLFQASVALTRSALEESLKDALRTKAPLLGRADELLTLIKGAELSKLLDGPLLQFAHEVRKTANASLHGTPCADEDAFDSLIKTRKILDSLYGRGKKSAR